MADIETVAEYWNRRPCNIRHSQREMGSRAYFDEVGVPPAGLRFYTVRSRVRGWF
jgi:hypothetical protein